MLWIAFRLYLWHTDHNSDLFEVSRPTVVNCFQIVSLTYRSQHALQRRKYTDSCELLSDCIFDIPITTLALLTFIHRRLWIAFRLYLWHTDHNISTILNLRMRVVNCFQIVSLTYRSQLVTRYLAFLHCCELLSDCIFDIPITTQSLLTCPKH